MIEVSQSTELCEGSVADYFSLLKPRVMSLVVFTALTGIVVAPGNIHPVLAFMALLLIAVGAGASGALNMWYDVDIDYQMMRTKSRPIPAGRIHRDSALTYGLFLAVVAVLCLGVFINWISAFLLAFTIFFYVVIYSIWLKRITPQNIVIGGAAGAFPPVIGWVAVTGKIDLYPLLLFGIIFFWTPPHFWALALLKQEEYQLVRIPMLPVVKGAQHTRSQIVIYTMLMSVFVIAPYGLGFAGLFYGITATSLTVLFVVMSLWLYIAPVIYKKQASRILFVYSILYLFLLFGGLLIDGLIQ